MARKPEIGKKKKDLFQGVKLTFMLLSIILL